MFHRKYYFRRYKFKDLSLPAVVGPSVRALSSFVSAMEETWPVDMHYAFMSRNYVKVSDRIFYRSTCDRCKLKRFLP